MKHFNKVYLVFIMLVMWAGLVSAQDMKITGKVTDDTGEPLPGVNIVQKGTVNGSTSNMDGEFSVSVAQGSVLIFSYIGFVTQEVSVNSQTVINVSLISDLSQLDEVIVVGYGTVKKKDVTGSVGSLSSEKLLENPITDLATGMQGKIAGVSIQNTSGAPGQNMKIRIRGGSSINYSNEPLYVIDGFIGANINNINPNDIASIDILKDASATAIYGSRGANGVVLITTNTPESGDLKVSLEGNVGVSKMVNKYELMPAGEMAETMNLQDISRDKPTNSFTAEEIAYFKENGGTDWQDLITQTGLTQNYTINANGGSDKLKYFFSGNMVDDKGVIRNSFYKRYSLRSNISGKISDWIDVQFNTFATHTSSQANGSGSNGAANPIGAAVRFPIFWDAYDEDGNYADPLSYPSYNGRFLPGRDQSPLQATDQNQESFGESITSNLDLNFNLGHGFSFMVKNAGSFNTGFYGQRNLVNGVDFNREDVAAQQDYSRGSTYLNTEILTYKKEFGKHDLKVDAIYEFQKSSWRSNSAKVADLTTLANEWYILGNGAPSISSSTYNESKIRSYMGRVNYGYNDKYLLTLSLRADGTSVFDESNRWGYFPSAAVAWRIADEAFMDAVGVVSDLKLRVGYGETGNRAVGPYATLPKLEFHDNYQWYLWDGETPVSGILPGEFANPDLRWETTKQLNLGLDFAFLEGKISGTLDLYDKNTEDVIISKTIPNYTGKNSLTGNFAEVRNKGIEFSMNAYIMDKADFRWTANFNISRNVNTVEDLDGNDEIFVASEEALGIWNIVGGNKFIVRKGESMGSLFGLKAVGLWQEDEAEEASAFNAYPGEVKYEDFDGDGQISGTDRQIIGQAAPDFTYGIGTNLYFKNFDLAIQGVGMHGNEIYNWSRNLMNQEILTPDYRNRWSPTNTGSTQQIMPRGTDQSLTYVVSQYVESGSFFKINLITLGYTLPESIANTMKIGGVRFYASVNNLVTFTKYSGLDPEGSSTPLNSDSQAGIDAFSYPLTRTFTGGLKVNF